MSTIELRINHYQAKLNLLQAKLAKFQKGISTALRALAVEVIVEISRLEVLISNLKWIASKVKEITLRRHKGQWRTWIAKISGEKDKVHGGFKKEFIEPTSREFDKKGETTARYKIEIDFNQIYQDSDGDFWVFKNLEGEIELISYQEVCWRFEQMKKIPF